jgi:hypothetical protein
MIRRIKNAFYAFAVVFGLGVSPGFHWSQTPSTRPQAGWYWYGGCREPKTLGLEILLDGKSIYHSSFRICRMRSTDVPPLREGPEVAFSLRGGHVFQGNLRTSPKEMVEANIWQAGCEPDGLLLGISFSAKGRVLLNTLHLAKADRASEALLDRGLVIRTNPISSSPR